MSDERDPLAMSAPDHGAMSSDAPLASTEATFDGAMPADGRTDAVAAPAGSMVPPSAAELAALAAATAAAIPMPRVGPTEEEARIEAAAAQTRKASDRRLRIGRSFMRLATFVMTLALLAGGVALGAAVFQRLQPPPVTVGDASTGGIAAPPVVKELTDALTTNNADSIRSAVSTGPYEKLAAELQTWDIRGVTSVETLATMQDGPRTATEIVIRAKTAAGNPLIINLVVHVDANKIVNFR